MANRIQIRRDTAANFITANPILAQGEQALEIDTLKEKIGDGIKVWTDLPYRIASADKHYTHTQNTVDTVWNIAHNLNKQPAVSVIDSAGTTVNGNIKHTDNNNVIITFNAAFSGKAIFN